MRPTASFLARLLFLVALGGCTRGPAPERLEQEVQARVDGLFGRTVLAVDSLRRQGSAPYRAADDGSSQIIVYYNGTFQFTETYDPSDWQGLSPTMLANALGAATGWTESSAAPTATAVTTPQTESTSLLMTHPQVLKNAYHQNCGCCK